MFDALSERLAATLGRVRSRGKLSEADVDGALHEVRVALLEADVNLDVARDFTARVRERALGAEVMKSLKPGHQVVKVVNEELAALMGGEGSELDLSGPAPAVVLMVGLQGSGKTTACAKLARHLAAEGRAVALAACDLQRPAAVDQLVTLGEQAGVPVYERGAEGDPVEVAGWALERARAEGRDVLIVDTAGRLHIDEQLMAELARIRKRVSPRAVLLAVDAMTGQDAANVAERFAAEVPFDGIVITKLDGDARGGAALSVNAVSGRPILFASTGEGLDQLERFWPDRMAGRILGMGDVLSLVEKAEREMDSDQARAAAERLQSGQFTLDDFLTQLHQLRKMGSLSGVLGMLPGMGAAMKQIKGMQIDDREIDRVEAIVLSMTTEERRRPELIDGSRRRRIAAGSGTSVQAVKQLTRQFETMREMMGKLTKGGLPNLGQMLGQARGGPQMRQPR